ncbi:MAG: hypothetical protein WD872_11675 [Pirellulaceae bacterium]
MPELMGLAAFCCQFGLSPFGGEKDRSSFCPDLPAPCYDEERKELTADSVDDHESSFFWIVDLQPLWQPSLSAGGRGFFSNSRDLFDCLHRRRI